MRKKPTAVSPPQGPPGKVGDMGIPGEPGEKVEWSIHPLRKQTVQDNEVNDNDWKCYS